MPWFIEHPTKGICTAVPGDLDDKWHFAWSKPRSDEARRDFWRLEHAVAKLKLAPDGCQLMIDHGIYKYPRFEVETRRSLR